MPSVPKLTDRPLVATLLGITLLALGARLYHLGQRVFYYDEAWFGYWTLRFIENGVWEYRPILHGPFFVRVNSIIFPTFGVSDGTARLVVALLGGLLPLSAWLFRKHLQKKELVALAILLAFNPILLYYSRFMRKDLPLAVFMFVTLGLLVRTYDTKQPRYLYGAAVSLALAFTTKESVLLWLVTWFGAGLLVLDRYLLRARETDTDALSTLYSFARRAYSGGRHWWPHGVLAGGVFLLIIVYFYAPRAGPGQQIGLWRALGGEFSTIPDVVWAATVGSFHKAVNYWVQGSIQKHPYLPYLGDTLQTLAAGALGVSLFALVGFLVERYAAESPRPLVGFNFYCGIAATVGYPLANNLPVPWSTIHAVIPLTIPAAVGACIVYRWGRGHIPVGETPRLPRVLRLQRLPISTRVIRVSVAAMILVALVGTSGLAAIQTSYLRPHESDRGADGGSEIIYYAQAPAEFREVTRSITQAAATGGADTDVLYVGAGLAMNESTATYPPATGGWHTRIPLPWYTEAAKADVASVRHPNNITSTPQVVITNTSVRESVAEQLDNNYTGKQYPLDDIGDRSIVVFIRNDTNAS